MLINILGYLIIVIIAALLWLFIEHRKLRASDNALSESLKQLNRDLAGLCSAAVSVDDKLLINDQQLRDLFEKIADLGDDELSVGPYESIIQRVRDGIGVEALISEYNLSLDEARLLIRIHGKQRQA